MRGGGVRAMPPGELLDAAVALFRTRALPLLLLAAPLQAIEQVVLRWVGVPWLGDPTGFGVWWRLIATVLAADAVIVWLLGAYAGAAVVPAVLGAETPGRALFRRMRPLPVLATALLPAVLVWPAAYFGLLGWILVHGFLGLAVAAAVVDRAGWPFGALGRSAALAARLGWRGFWIRQWGFLLWTGVRVALAIGPITLLGRLGLIVDGDFGAWPALLVWGLAGAVTCACLACLDAVLLVDTRVRTEGLDITLRRAVAHGADPLAAVAHTRPRDVAPIAIPAHPGLPPWPSALVRPSVPAGLSRQAQLQWMQAQAQARYQAPRDEEREP